MLLRTDYRKLNALFLFALILFLLGVWAALDMDGGGRIVWTWFFVLSGFLFTSTGLLVRSKYRLTNDYLEITNLLGIFRKRIALSDIKKVKYIQKELPASYYAVDLLWLFLWDKKFKRFKQLKLYSKEKEIAQIDGHYIQDTDFEILRKKIK